MLLIGFSKKDGEAVAAWMEQMEAGFAVSHCTEDMLNGTVFDALRQGDADTFRVEGHTVIAEPLPRLVILSGVSGEETIAIAEHWEMFTGVLINVSCICHMFLLYASLTTYQVKARTYWCCRHITADDGNSCGKSVAKIFAGCNQGHCKICLHQVKEQIVTQILQTCSLFILSYYCKIISNMSNYSISISAAVTAGAIPMQTQLA